MELKNIMCCVKTDFEKQAGKGMEIVNRVSLNHMKAKHPSQVCRADRWLSYGRSAGGCCGHRTKAKRTVYIRANHMGA